eukprot:scaffold13594_cov88-Isochrysis_galbana.AAC.3
MGASGSGSREAREGDGNVQCPVSWSEQALSSEQCCVPPCPPPPLLHRTEGLSVLPPSPPPYLEHYSPRCPPSCHVRARPTARGPHLRCHRCSHLLRYQHLHQLLLALSRLAPRCVGRVRLLGRRP